MGLAALGGLSACNEETPSTSSEITMPKPATDFTSEKIKQLKRSMPQNIEREREFAMRGFIAGWPEAIIEKNKGGTPSVNFEDNDFLEGEAPDTVNPLLWEHSKVMGAEGLFEVVPGIYQVRGFDVANITFVDTDNGYIVIDPLTSAEPAAAAYALVKEHIADKPVIAVIYTHTHSDHFAGILGVVDREDINSGKVQIIAPENFMEETIKEWMIAGTAMGRRAFYQFGLFLPYSEREHVGMGTGPRIALGDVALIPPTHSITRTGETLNIDGTQVVFQLTPGAEAPAEMNFYFPKYKALCMAETATGTIHNVQTLRGASVRDAKAWADYLTQAQDLFGDKSETIFVAHHWPRFGKEYINEYLSKHRDAYKFIHDQTVRMMNSGMTPNEISDALELPDSLSGEWYNRGFYGSLSHNAKAVYDKYMGWYNGIPADLNPHSPVQRGQRYVDALGGARDVMGVADVAFKDGDYRWSAELLQHLVFAEPKNKMARERLADSYEQMGYIAESAIWRNIYLTAARELRLGGPDQYKGGSEDYILGGASDGQVMDLLAVRLLPEKAADVSLSVNIIFRATGKTFNMRVDNSVLVYREDNVDMSAPTLNVTRQGFLAVALGYMSLDQAVAANMLSVVGDPAPFISMSAMFDNPGLDFNIIEP